VLNSNDSSHSVDEVLVSEICKGGEFSTLNAEWDSLLTKSEFDSVFLSHGWFRSFCDAWPYSKKLAVLLAYQNGHLVGAAPLMLCSGRHLGFPAKLLSFIENDETPHCSFIFRKGADKERILFAFLRHASTKIDNWDVLLLRKIPELASWTQCIQRYCEANGHTHVARISLRSPILKVESDWTSFYSQKSQRFKKRIRYAKNKLKRHGAIEVRECHDPKEVKSLLGQVFDIGSQSWKEKIGFAIGSTPERRTFFSKLPDSLGSRGIVSLWYLSLNNQMIAFEYHVKQQRITYALRAEFDEAYRHLGPGSVLDFEVARSLFENDVESYNMCGSPDEYKLRWTSQVKSHTDVLVFNRHLYGMLLGLLEKRIKPLAKILFNKLG